MPFPQVSISAFDLNLTFCRGSVSLWPEYYFCFAREEVVITHILDLSATSECSIRRLMRATDVGERATKQPQWFHRRGSWSSSYSTDAIQNSVSPAYYFNCCFQSTVSPLHKRTVRDKEMGWGPKAQCSDEEWSLGPSLFWSLTRQFPSLVPSSLSCRRLSFACTEVLMIHFWGVRRAGGRGSSSLNSTAFVHQRPGLDQDIQ